MITGLKAHEPEVEPGPLDYENEMLIDFPPGTFFSWHSILTSRTVSFLKSSQTKNISLIRNIYDVLLSMLTHLSRDVDYSIDRSVGGEEYFVRKTIEQCLTLMICGFTSPQMTWMGAGPLIKQIDSILAFVECGQALLLDYEQLTHDKRKTIQKILKTLEFRIPSKRIKEIIANTDKDRMRERLKKIGRDSHVTSHEHALSRDVFLPYHKEMIDRIVLTNAPRLPERLSTLGLDSILHLKEEEPRSNLTALSSTISSWLCSKGIHVADSPKK